jgi:hypothetical protein
MLLAGHSDAAEVFQQVSDSGGWPIRRSDGTFVFASLAPGDLSGDHNGWTRDPLAQTGEVYWIEAEIPEPTGALYKFVSGEDWGPDPWSRAYGTDENGEFSLVRGGGGHLERFFAVGDSAMEARTLRVWVPEEPVDGVLVVQDGQNLFDPEAPWGGWRLQDALGPSTMAVGVDNTAARIEEYTHVEDFVYAEWMGGEGDAYADFLVGTVLPRVEVEYGLPARVGVMGSSLGGLVAFHAALRDPEAWAFAASLSGTMGWGSIGAANETMIERYSASGYTGVALYLDSGGDDGGGCVDSDGDGTEDDNPSASDNYCENRQMADALAAAGWTWEEDLWHWWEPGATHDEAAWSDRVGIPVAVFEGL